jgi:hypothetical protein
MAGRNVIILQALRPNDRTQTLTYGAARLAKHQAPRTRFPLQNLTISQIRIFEGRRN